MCANDDHNYLVQKCYSLHLCNYNSGLAWQDRGEKIFRISWKHAANQCFNMQKDTNLFERWAIHTGDHILVSICVGWAA